MSRNSHGGVNEVKFFRASAVCLVKKMWVVMAGLRGNSALRPVKKLVGLETTLPPIVAEGDNRRDCCSGEISEKGRFGYYPE